MAQVERVGEKILVKPDADRYSPEQNYKRSWNVYLPVTLKGLAEKHLPGTVTEMHVVVNAESNLREIAKAAHALLQQRGTLVIVAARGVFAQQAIEKIHPGYEFARVERVKDYEKFVLYKKYSVEKEAPAPAAYRPWEKLVRPADTRFGDE